jgi:hypothetical protein
MVNSLHAPAHARAPYLGVTLMVAVMGVVPAFTVVNAAILPVPLAANPIVGSSFVQV